LLSGCGLLSLVDGGLKALRAGLPFSAGIIPQPRRRAITFVTARAARSAAANLNVDDRNGNLGLVFDGIATMQKTPGQYNATSERGTAPRSKVLRASHWVGASSVSRNWTSPPANSAIGRPSR
jgi:hypothetical protein